MRETALNMPDPEPEATKFLSLKRACSTCTVTGEAGICIVETASVIESTANGYESGARVLAAINAPCVTVANRQLQQYIPNGYRLSDFVAVMDEFYRDPAHRMVDMESARTWVGARLRGIPAAQLAALEGQIMKDTAEARGTARSVK